MARGPEGENCVVDPAERASCGAGEALKMEDCLSQGCCWDPVDPGSGAAWCFESAGNIFLLFLYATPKTTNIMLQFILC